MPWKQRRLGRLPDATFDAIVKRAAKLAAKEVEDRFYEELGRNLIRRAMQAVGLFLVAAVLLYLQVKFNIQLPTGLKP